MPSDRKIYRAARALIRAYGNEAAVRVAIRADEIDEAGDIESCRTWTRILAAITDLQRGRRNDEPVN